MTPQAIAGIANIGLSAMPLLFGENSIFSKKGREANRELKKNFQASQSMQLPGEYTEAMQNLRAQANQGIPSAAIGLYQQQAGRQQAAQLGALGSRRSALAGIGSIAQAGQDAALNLASMQGQALQAGQQRLNQGLMQMGGLQYQEALRKIQDAADYYGVRKAERNAAITGALKGMGSAIGSALGTDAFKGLGKKSPAPAPSSPTDFGLKAPTFKYEPYDFSGGASSMFSSPSLNYTPQGLPGAQPVLRGLPSTKMKF